jgi:predicted enzyme related to lactoylglutathione lyase
MRACARTQARIQFRGGLSDTRILTLTASANSIGASSLLERLNKLSLQSTNMPRVVHFEIYTNNPDAVRPFYQDVFGWNFQKFEGGPREYWLVTTGDEKQPGINGGLTRPREGQSPGTLNTIGVSSLDQTIEQIEKHGEKICVPTMVIPKVGRLTYAQDPAGNVFGIIEPDTNAS